MPGRLIVDRLKHPPAAHRLPCMRDVGHGSASTSAAKATATATATASTSGWPVNIAGCLARCHRRERDRSIAPVPAPTAADTCRPGERSDPEPPQWHDVHPTFTRPVRPMERMEELLSRFTSRSSPAAGTRPRHHGMQRRCRTFVPGNFVREHARCTGFGRTRSTGRDHGCIAGRQGR